VIIPETTDKTCVPETDLDQQIVSFFLPSSSSGGNSAKVKNKENTKFKRKAISFHRLLTSDDDRILTSDDVIQQKMNLEMEKFKNEKRKNEKNKRPLQSIKQENK
jgi:hypothetical protein